MSKVIAVARGIVFIGLAVLILGTVAFYGAAMVFQSQQASQLAHR